MGHRSIKCSLFSSHHSTVGDVNGAFHSLAHTILLSSAASLNRFFLITLLFEKSRANQARRISSPTRTLIAVIFLLSLFFFCKFQTTARLCSDTLTDACSTHSMGSARYFLCGASKSKVLILAYKV